MESWRLLDYVQVPYQFGNVQGKCFHTADLSVTSEAAPRPPEISRLFERRRGPPLYFSEFLSRRPSRSWSRVPSVTLALSCVITSHPRSFSRPVLLLSHHFSCYTALSSKCFVAGCYALMACSMWSLGSWLGGSLVSAWCCVASLSRPRGSVGIAAFLTSLTDCRWWFDPPRWSASKTQDRRPAERQRARTQKKLVLCCFSHTAVWQCDFGVFVFPLFLVLPTNTWDDTMLSPLTFVVQSEGGYVYAIIR